MSEHERNRFHNVWKRVIFTLLRFIPRGPQTSGRNSMTIHPEVTEMFLSLAVTLGCKIKTKSRIVASFIHSHYSGHELQNSAQPVRKQTVINKRLQETNFSCVRSIYTSVNFRSFTIEAALHHYIYGQSACRFDFYLTYWTNFNVLSWLERSNRRCSFIICSSAAVVFAQRQLESNW